MWARVVPYLRGLVTELNAGLAKGDKRTSHWFLLEGISPLLAILIIYYMFCVKIGPSLMKHRNAFDLKNMMIAYNLVNVMGCIWLVNETLQGGWLSSYSLRCQPVDISTSPEALRMARATWFYFIFKVIELADTVFFVLRKKDNQVTKLHLYHHILMPLGSWYQARFIPGGHGTFGILLNTSVHVIMYSYYLVAALGPKYQKYIWWKKYLTMIQIVQFAMVFIHQIQILFNECNYPKAMVIFILFNAVLFIQLFSNFFKRNYSDQQKTLKSHKMKSKN